MDLSVLGWFMASLALLAALVALWDARISRGQARQAYYLHMQATVERDALHGQWVKIRKQYEELKRECDALRDLLQQARVPLTALQQATSLRQGMSDFGELLDVPPRNLQEQSSWAKR